MARKRAVSVNELNQYKPRLLEFSGAWFNLLGKPELRGGWLVWGQSGNGKTRFALQLAKYMSGFARVAYNSLEEGISQSMKQAFSEVGMMEASGRIILLDQEPIAELIARLKKPKSPRIVFIDSLQYTGMNYADYKRLKDLFKDKLFILVSHAEGRDPAGRVAKSIRFDANVKIRIEGFRAFAISRYGGGLYYDVWPDEAKSYWGERTIPTLVEEIR